MYMNSYGRGFCCDLFCLTAVSCSFIFRLDRLMQVQYIPCVVATKKWDQFVHIYNCVCSVLLIWSSNLQLGLILALPNSLNCVALHFNIYKQRSYDTDVKATQKKYTKLVIFSNIKGAWDQTIRTTINKHTKDVQCCHERLKYVLYYSEIRRTIYRNSKEDVRIYIQFFKFNSHFWVFNSFFLTT